MRGLVLLALCASLLTIDAACVAEDFDSLPRHYREAIFPHLKVRQKQTNEQQSLAFIAQLRSRGIGVFNPFGDSKMGRCYRIVLLNADGSIVHEIVSPTPAKLPESEFDFVSLDDGIVGRCHWTDLDAADPQKRPDDAATLPEMKPGQYRCVLLVTAGMFRLHGWSFYHKHPEVWHDLKWSQDLCASEPVELFLGVDGRWSADAMGTSLPTFSALEVEPHTNAFHDLALTVWFVNPEERNLLVPAYDLFLPHEGRSLHTSAQRDDGFPLGRFRRMIGRTRSHPVAMQSDIRRIPRNGVVGGYQSQLGTFSEGGDYRIVVTIDESIFADRRFWYAKEVKPPTDGWKEVFRSPVVTVTIPNLKSSDH